MPNMGTLKKSTLSKSVRLPAGAGSPVTTPKKVPAKLTAHASRTPVTSAKLGSTPLMRESGAAYRVIAQPASPKTTRATPAGGLASALFTTTQQRTLGLLFGDPNRSFFANELILLTGSGSGAVQRELARLESSGLVTAHWIGNQKHYQANKESPIFSELRDIVQKTVGVARPLQEALGPLAAHIHTAFVYGSLAKKQDSTTSDIDVMVISDSLSYADLFSALEPATTRLGRPVNPTVLSLKELARRIKAGNAFIGRVLAQPKIWLIGGESDLGV